MNNTVFVVGLGPGDPQFLTAQAQSALTQAEVLCGYTVYLDLVRPYFPEKEYYSTGMTQEIDRCRWALETARRGKVVALVCSGDAGVYGMASPLLELAEQFPEVAVAAGGSGSGRFLRRTVQPFFQGQAGLSGQSRPHPAGPRQTAADRLWAGAEHRAGGAGPPHPDPGGTGNRPGGYVHHRLHRQHRHPAAGRKDGHTEGVSRMKIVVFSGTTEGRLFSCQLAAQGAEVLVSVATPLGAEEQGRLQGVTVHCGRLTPEEMTTLLQGAALCVDATHPYAVDATKNIRSACKTACIEYHRLLRAESPLPVGSMVFQSAAHAAEFLANTCGNLLLATGAKELSAFSGIEPARLFPRVLPTPEGIAACEAAHIPHKNIIAMQGPFSYALNRALLEQFHIRFLVTKDGGAAGGFAEKAQAAQDTGAQLIVLRRPAEQGETAEQILTRCKEVLAWSH